MNRKNDNRDSKSMKCKMTIAIVNQRTVKMTDTIVD